MRFQVPQFIEIEDKIFGPFTFKQFVYLAGGAGIAFIVYQALPLFLAALFIIPIVSFSLALAFYKVNNRPFIFMVESSFRHLLRRKLYTWKKEERAAREEERNAVAEAIIPKLSEGKLKDIAWSLDVHDSIYAGEERQRREPPPRENPKDYFKL